MKLPVGISKSAFLAYKHDGTLENRRKLKAENFEWDLYHPKSLVLICIEKLSENWMGSPKLEEFVAKDREIFLRILNTNVPLQILVDNINNDIFWEKCYCSKWKDFPAITDSKRWINVFMERYYADILENINPRHYDPEKIKSLVKLCGPFIQSLSIRSLIPADIPVQRIISPEMTDLITSQRYNGHKTQPKAPNEALTRG